MADDIRILTRKLHSITKSDSDDIRALLPRGFEVIGALIVGTASSSVERTAKDAIDASSRLRKALSQSENQSLVGAVVDPSSGGLSFFVSNSVIELVTTVVYEEQPDKYVWERGCILYCELPIKLPVIYSVKELKGAEDMLARAIEAVIAKFRDTKTTYVLETLDGSITEAPHAVVIRNRDLDLSTESNASSLLCSHFCFEDNNHKSHSAENADKILVSFLLSTSGASLKPVAPVAEYIPGEAKLLVVDYKLKVICYATKDLRLTDAVSKLIIPGLVDSYIL
ncbi:putative Ufm1-specific protease [Bidens hawaiensis]|uniref:putative Ufm1-specific protease n=1 Tax=Bidens hawaiensis TaxID=980011 RepID=UPI0040497359